MLPLWGPLSNRRGCVLPLTRAAGSALRFANKLQSNFCMPLAVVISMGKINIRIVIIQQTRIGGNIMHRFDGRQHCCMLNRFLCGSQLWRGSIKIVSYGV